MAYNNYGGGNDRYGGGGYGQANPYQQESNPYAQQQSNPYAQQASNPYAQQSSSPYGQQQGRYENTAPYSQGNQGVEMQNLQGQQQNPYGNGQVNGNAYEAPPQQSDPHAILNECRDVQRAIDDLEGQLSTLQRAQRGFVSGTGVSNKELDATAAEIMGQYRALADRVKRIKSKPEAKQPQNAPQVNNLDRRIKKAITTFREQEASFRKDVQDQQRRQYLIVNPNASEAEIREATEGGGDTQIFQQALLNADRRGQAQTTLRSVQQRHDAIQQIERTMLELAQLFQDLDQMVVEQEPLVQKVEEHAENTQTHMVEANTQLTQATEKARAARKKKWICFWIVVVIIIVVLVIIFAYGATSGHWFDKSANRKRDVESAAHIIARDVLPLLRRGAAAEVEELGALRRALPLA